MTQHGFKDATVGLNRITAWWQEWPGANIGIPTGWTSKHLVGDEDPRNGGDDSLNLSFAKHGRFAGSAEAITDGGERHHVFRYQGMSLPKVLAPGVDLRYGHGYMVAAPSRHRSGGAYQRSGLAGARALFNPAGSPPWLLILIETKRTSNRGATIPPQLPGRVSDGQKYNTIVSLAGTLRRRRVAEVAAFAACRALRFQSAWVGFPRSSPG
jgi:hypothetical protein